MGVCVFADVYFCIACLFIVFLSVSLPTIMLLCRSHCLYMFLSLSFFLWLCISLSLMSPLLQNFKAAFLPCFPSFVRCLTNIHFLKPCLNGTTEHARSKNTFYFFIECFSTRFCGYVSLLLLVSHGLARRMGQ